jgi:hypothetical protein
MVFHPSLRLRRASAATALRFGPARELFRVRSNLSPNTTLLRRAGCWTTIQRSWPITRKSGSKDRQAAGSPPQASLPPVSSARKGGWPARSRTRPYLSPLSSIGSAAISVDWRAVQRRVFVATERSRTIRNNPVASKPWRKLPHGIFLRRWRSSTNRLS